MAKAGSPSASESGIILSETNEPIQYVSVINNRTETWSISDDNGYFSIPQKTKNGDSLHFERIGIQNKIFIYTGKMLTIILNKDPILFPEITIHNPTVQSHHLSKKGFGRNELVNSIPGTLLRSYGGSAGIALTSIDGGQTKDVKVVFNQIDLTSPQLGMTDLSQIPFQLLGYLNTQSNSNLTYGSGTTDGVIQIHPWATPTGIQLQRGNDKSHSLSLHYNLNSKDQSINFLAGQNIDLGTHPVIYNEEEISRENQYFKQTFFGANYKKKYENWISHFSGWHSIQDRGISGLIWSPNSAASRQDSLSLVSGSLVRLLPKGFLRTSITYRESSENYLDPNLNIDSKHLSKNLSSTFMGIYSPNSNLKFRSTFGYSNEQVKSTDAGNNYRDIFFFAPSLSISNIIGINLLSALRLDHYSDFGTALNYSFQIDKQVFNLLNFSASTGSSFRAPTFNDLYWNPGGNIHLKPESSHFTKIALHAKTSLLSIEIFNKSKYSDHLIVWNSSGNYWKPENIEKSSRNIVGINTSLGFSDRFTLNSSIQNIQSKNHSSGNQLRYSPEWIGNMSIQIKYSNWVMRFDTHLTGKQLVMVDYPSNLELDPTLISNISLTSPHFYQDQFQLTFHVSNVLNHELITIYGYPEPSRLFRLNISYQLKQKETQ